MIDSGVSSTTTMVPKGVFNHPLVIRKAGESHSFL